MNESWIKLHNKFLNWEWYQDTNTKAVFIHCLLKANWKDGKFNGIDVPRGSYVTGRKKLSEELNLSEQEVRTALEHLKSTNEITIKSTNRFSIISIKNYDKYQQNNQQNNFQSTTIEEYKNNNTYTYINNIERNLGRTMSPYEVELIEHWIKENNDIRKIDYAIRETIINGVKNLKYTDAILKNIKNKSYEELINKEEQDEIEVFDYDWLNGEE